MSIEFEPSHGLIIVQAELWGPAGSTVIRLALDTGAITTLINASPLVWVGYDPAAILDRVQITTGSGVEFAPLVNVRRISALGKQYKDITVVCHTLPPSTNVDGLLGLDVLRRQSLNIDFRAGEITLS
jgi:predicted aspartyl protease